MFKWTFLFTLLLVHGVTYAQSQIIFQPPNPYFFTSDQIWNFSILNNGKSAFTADLNIELRRNGTSFIVSGVLHNIYVSKGISTIGVATREQVSLTYGIDATASNFAETGILLPGEFTLCVRIQNLNNGNQINGCQEFEVKSFTLPILTYPSNNASLEATLPLFTWIPVSPGTMRNLRYTFELWESDKSKGFGKMFGDHFTTSTAVPSLQYTHVYPDLLLGRTYTWMVTAYTGDYLLGPSQIWTFKIGENSMARTAFEEEEDSYRRLGDETQKALYYANGLLQFAYLNITNDSLLRYSIYELNQPDSLLDALPEISIRSGMNKISIDLTSAEGIEEETEYVLDVMDGNEKHFKLKFEYIYEE